MIKKQIHIILNKINNLKTMTNTKIKYEHISVNLNIDSHALSIIAAVSRALRKNGIAVNDIKDFENKALSCSYNELLQLILTTVTVTYEEDDDGIDLV